MPGTRAGAGGAVVSVLGLVSAPEARGLVRWSLYPGS